VPVCLKELNRKSIGSCDLSLGSAKITFFISYEDIGSTRARRKSGLGWP
jgi:hypothetical protein